VAVLRKPSAGFELGVSSSVGMEVTFWCRDQEQRVSTLLSLS
jgi:hypothetical protein